MTLEAFLEHLEQARLDPSTQNIVADGLTKLDVFRWHEENGDLQLPEELLALYRATNGIGFAVDDAREPYVSLLPLAEIHRVRDADWGDAKVSADWLVLSAHADGSSYVVYDQAHGRYLLVDPCGIDDKCVLGASTAELFDRLWEQWVVKLRDDSQAKAQDVLDVLRGIATGLPKASWRIVNDWPDDPESAAIGLAADPRRFAFITIRKQERAKYRLECEPNGTTADHLSKGELVDRALRHLSGS